jgi:hypothetical protein
MHSYRQFRVIFHPTTSEIVLMLGSTYFNPMPDSLPKTLSQTLVKTWLFALDNILPMGAP